MSLTFGFYNSLDGDRTYDAIQMSSIFDGVISDGIFATIGDAFAVTSISGDIIGIGSGRAWFDHTWTLNSDRHVMTLGPSEVIGDRIDAVVLEVNELLRANRFLVLEGEPTTDTPSRPELTDTDKIHQHVLAYIYRTGAAESITQSDITNMIGTSATPFVTGIIDTVDVDQLLAQWDSQFGDWFDEMKDQLSTDAAGHLQNQIGNLNNLTTEAKNNLVSAINEAASTGGGGSVTAEDVGTGTYEEPLIQISEGGTGARTTSGAINALNIYPVGSIYMSVNNVNPSALFGGTWEQIEDTFLLASGQTYTAGSTGGEAEHTLSTNEIPTHNHSGLTRYDGYPISNHPFGTYSSYVGETISIDVASSSSNHYMTTANEGGGQAHNNMPPYLVVYVWKRVS